MTIPESNIGKERYETKTIPETKDMKERSTIKRGKGKVQCNVYNSEIINSKTLDTHILSRKHIENERKKTERENKNQERKEGKMERLNKFIAESEQNTFLGERKIYLKKKK